ncbi:hypothetical protein GCM10009555_093800 [Acrocarpospora macrocephala]|uniref:SH3b domain-containing protein n=1 Tax=Acrocarpospora macrocephala TaxID=150177 RepID=A0A5M3X0C4_9ACTN|nr:hypothetical protein [Acrocarpospora macrocephala]GES14052.1 hypothetical protein Amac_076490 [Acrocarpospora macrocephala]
MRTTARLVLIAALAFCAAAVLPSAAQALPGPYVTTYADAPGRPRPCLNDTPTCRPVGIVKRGSHLVYCQTTGATVILGGYVSNWWVMTDLGADRVFIPALYVDNWDVVSRSLPYC